MFLAHAILPNDIAARSVRVADSRRMTTGILDGRFRTIGVSFGSEKTDKIRCSIFESLSFVCVRECEPLARFVLPTYADIMSKSALDVKSIVVQV
jgi:hypothetical protein